MGLRFSAIATLVLAGSIWTVWPGEESTGASVAIVHVRDARVPAIVHQVRAAAIEVEVDPDLEIEDDEPAQPTPDIDGLTDEERWESQVAEREHRVAPHRGTLHGLVQDARTTERLAGVTVIVTSPGVEGAQVAITDEDGYYAITGLPSGAYLVTFYYLDLTVERSNVSVAAGTLTPLMQRLQQDTRRPFENVIVTLDEAVDLDDLPTFTGIESMQNSYDVDSVDITGLTLGDDK